MEHGLRWQAHAAVNAVGALATAVVVVVIAVTKFTRGTWIVVLYIDKMEKQRGGDYMTIILPEFLPAKWCQHLLRNQTALLLKTALLFRRGKVAISIPYYLAQ